MAPPEPNTRNNPAVSSTALRSDLMSDRLAGKLDYPSTSTTHQAGVSGRRQPSVSRQILSAAHAVLVVFVVALFLSLIAIELTPGCVVSASGATTGCGTLGVAVALVANGGIITFVVHVLTALPLWGLLCLMHRSVRSVYTSG